MRGRTVVLVSHHVQLCAPGAGYIVALDNGRVQFQGDRSAFQASDVLRTLIQSGGATVEDDQEKLPAISSKEQSSDSEETADPSSETSSTTAAATEAETKAVIRKGPRKLVEEEKRAVGRIGKDIWLTYIKACGGSFFWTLFIVSLLLAALSPVFENGWLRYVPMTLDSLMLTDTQNLVSRCFRRRRQRPGSRVLHHCLRYRESYSRAREHGLISHRR